MDIEKYMAHSETEAGNYSINGYRRWPFLATRLFYTEIEDINATKDPSYQKKGILSYRHACGFVYDFSARVFNEMPERYVSIVIIQGSDQPPYGSTQTSNGNRIDPEMLKHIAGHEKNCPLCNCRCYNNNCEELEYIVAKTFNETPVDGSTPQHQANLLKEALHQMTDPEITEKAHEQKECSACYTEACTCYGHKYFMYNCPKSLIGNVMMPVEVNGVVVASAIVRQFIWSSAHLTSIVEENCISNGIINEFYSPENNEKIIRLLAETVINLEKSLEQRLARNASGLFAEIYNGVHARLANTELSERTDINKEFDSVLVFLRGRLSFSEIWFCPFDRREDKLGEVHTIYGHPKKSTIDIRPITRYSLEPIAYLAKNKNATVYLTKADSLLYELHLFQEDGIELCRLGFQLMVGEKKYINLSEWQDLCDHMETVLRELYMRWAIGLRNEEQSQYMLTMRQFTHELGQKSHSGNACMMQMHYQIQQLYEQCALIQKNSASQTTTAMNILSDLSHTTNDMESIFDGIGYLSQLARAKAQGLKFNPCLFDVRFATLNSMAAQYRIDIRSRGMQIKYQEMDSATSRIYGDKDLVHIAIHNLISNAVKYGYLGTNIYYSCYRMKGKDGLWGTAIDVTDYGLHIPEEDWERVFLDGERLSEERNDSLGFGLFLTQEIMARHGGYCEIVESKIVSDYSLPNLREMLRFADQIPSGMRVDADTMQKVLDQSNASGLYARIVNRSLRVSDSQEAPMTKRGLFRSGLKPMAQTTIRLFFPDR